MATDISQLAQFTLFFKILRGNKTQYKFSKSVFGKDAILKTVYLWPNVLISEDEFNYVIEVNSPDRCV